MFIALLSSLMSATSQKINIFSLRLCYVNLFVSRR